MKMPRDLSEYQTCHSPLYAVMTNMDTTSLYIEMTPLILTKIQ